MRRLAGQAGRHAARLVHFSFAVAVAVLVLLAMISWRLSRGPVNLPWLAMALERTYDDGHGGHLAVASAALAWEGFSEGVDSPIDIRVRGVVVTDPSGVRIASIPQARVALSASRLLIGTIAPRAIEIDDAKLLLVRDEAGELTLAIGGEDEIGESTGGGVRLSSAHPSTFAADLMRELAHAPLGDGAGDSASRWSQLRRLRIRESAVTVVDHLATVTWGLRGLAIDLSRNRKGGVTGRAESTVSIGQQTSVLITVSGELDRVTGGIGLTVHTGEIAPAALARALPFAASFAPFNVPIALDATMQFDADLTPGPITLHADIADGTLHIDDEDVAVLGGTLDAEGTLAHLSVRLDQLEIATQPDGKRTGIVAHADLERSASGEFAASGGLDLDQIAFADLPALWPKGAGGPGARNWVTANITAGLASHGHVDFGLLIPADLSDAAVTQLHGSIDGSDLTIRWLKQVPPIEHGSARLSFDDMDKLAIAVTGGAQAGGSAGGMRIAGGHVYISGLRATDQFADIEADLAGPVPDLLTLLRDPGIKLLDRSPLPIKGAAGHIQGKVAVANLPLRDAITMDDVAIRAHAQATALRLDNVAAGRDLSNGLVTFDVTNDGLRAAGTADVAGIPAQLQFSLDFRSGPRTQIMQRVTASATADAKQLSGLGFDVAEFMSGSVGLNATLSVQRGGEGEAKIEANLTAAGLKAASLGVIKTQGRPANATATIMLAGDMIAAISPIHLEGEGLRLDASASFVAGRPDLVTIREAKFGDTTDVTGSVRLPRMGGEPWRIELSGPVLDVSERDTRRHAAPVQPSEPAKPGPAYIADARLERVVLGKGRVVAGLVVHVEDDGVVTHRASVSGRTLSTGGGVKGGEATFTLSIVPDGKVRKLSAGTADAGGLLRALDIDDKIERGRMTLAGTFDDSRPDRPLAGTAIVQDFRVHDAPVLGRLLQAMTLYGLVDVARGPGLGFSRLEAPFRYAGDSLELIDARAFSASLGMTAKGTIDLARRRADLQGTIVPAYFFNSLLGNIPIVGRIFSPERGGGLFAATYAVRGSLDDPSIAVNPLAALTPGFLRGLFKLFDDTGRPAEPGQRPSH